MKKLILIIAILSLISCSKEEIKPTVEKMYNIEYKIDVETYIDNISIFYRKNTLIEISDVGDGSYSYTCKAKRGATIECGFLGKVTHVWLRIYVNGNEYKNAGFACFGLNSTEYTCVKFTL